MLIKQNQLRNFLTIIINFLAENITIKDSFDISFQFRTSQPNGVLMLIVDSKTNDSFFIELYDSQVSALLLVFYSLNCSIINLTFCK
jgi:hypothetical protein